jgi:hypothetical protein
VDPILGLDDVQEIEPQFLSHAPHSLVAAPTKLLLILWINTRDTRPTRERGTHGRNTAWTPQYESNVSEVWDDVQ